MKRPIALIVTVLLISTFSTFAQAQFSHSRFNFGFGSSGCGTGFRTPLYGGFGGHYGFHSAPHYGQHFGTHVGPYNDFSGFRGYGVHSGDHVDLHSGRHRDFHDSSGHFGSPFIGVPAYGYASPFGGYCDPGYYNGFSLSYGLPLGNIGVFGTYSNFSSRGTTSFYGPSIIGGTDLSDLAYSRRNEERAREQVAVRTQTKNGNGAEKSEAAKSESKETNGPELPKRLPSSILAGNVVVNFVDSNKGVEIEWKGNPEEVKAVTFVTKDSARIPVLLRRVNTPPFKTRFDYGTFIRHIAVDVELKNGVTSSTNIPVP